MKEVLINFPTIILQTNRDGLVLCDELDASYTNWLDRIGTSAILQNMNVSDRENVCMLVKNQSKLMLESLVAFDNKINNVSEFGAVLRTPIARLNFIFQLFETNK